jgi:hypothetical protein
VEELEARILPRVEESLPPKQTMIDVIFQEWLRGLDSFPDTADRATVGCAWDDLIRRFKECPITAEYGEQLERYREIIIDETLRRHAHLGRGDLPEYEEA